MFHRRNGKIQGAGRPLLWMFPISNNDESLTLEFVYDLGEPRYNVEEASRKTHLFRPLKATFRDPASRRRRQGQTDSRTGCLYLRHPADDKNATFVINGAERVVVSQFASISRSDL